LKNNYPNVFKNLSAEDTPPPTPKKMMKMESLALEVDSRPSTSFSKYDEDDPKPKPEVEKRKIEMPIVEAFNRSLSYAKGGIKYGRLINC